MTGTGLRAWARDGGLPLRAGQPELAPPSIDELLVLVRNHLLLPDAPELSEAVWNYARWKPGVSTCAAYQLRFADGSEETVVAKRYVGDKAEGLAERPASRASDGGLAETHHLGPPRAFPEQRLYIWAAQDDRELSALRDLTDWKRCRRLFRHLALFPDRSIRNRKSSVTRLRYRPERRAVVRMDLSLRSKLTEHEYSKLTVAARCLPPRRARQVAAHREACGELPFSPRCLGLEPRMGLVVEEWLDVEMPAADAFDHAERAGEVLAALACRPAPDQGLEARECMCFDSLRPLFDWSPTLRAATSQLSPDLPGVPGPLVWTHGDFHPDQVGRDRSTGASRLLDLDELAPGDIHADLASWIADHLVSQPDAGWDAAAAPLLAGFARGGGQTPDGDRLAASVAAELVQRAAACCRRLERDAEATAHRLLEQANGLAPDGSIFR
jgi:hypothetical protein